MERCQICSSQGPDLRVLCLEYLYKLEEISDKFQVERIGTKTFYILLTCKECRGEFLGLLRRWTQGEFVAPPDRPDADISVRIDGRTVMMTQAEWEEHLRNQGQPYRPPYRLKP